MTCKSEDNFKIIDITFRNLEYDFNLKLDSQIHCNPHLTLIFNMDISVTIALKACDEFI